MGRFLAFIVDWGDIILPASIGFQDAWVKHESTGRVWWLAADRECGFTLSRTQWPFKPASGCFPVTYSSARSRPEFRPC